MHIIMKCKVAIKCYYDKVFSYIIYYRTLIIIKLMLIFAWRFFLENYYHYLFLHVGQNYFAFGILDSDNPKQVRRNHFI